MATHNTMKELFRLIRDVDKLSDGQAKVYLNDDDDDLTFHLEIKPKDGLYKGGKCKFMVALDNDYPAVPPKVSCCNVIYHPNIDVIDEISNGEVCINVLESDWSSEVGLDGCVMAILFLFHNPELNDPLNPAFHGEVLDFDEFAKNVKSSMRGEIEINGFTFDKIIDSEEDNDVADDIHEFGNSEIDMKEENITKKQKRENRRKSSILDLPQSGENRFSTLLHLNSTSSNEIETAYVQSAIKSFNEKFTMVGSRRKRAKMNIFSRVFRWMQNCSECYS